MLEHLTEKDPATGEYRIPKIIYSDAYSSEMVAYADLILPDTTYLERWDCISLLDRPISEADGAGRRDPPAGGRARPRRARRSRTCCSISARGSSCRACHRRRRAALSRRLPRLHRQPRARARHRPAGRLPRRGRRALTAAARPTRSSSSLYRRRLLPRARLAPEQRYYKHANKAYLDWALRQGLHRRACAGDVPALSASRCRSCASPRAGTARSCRPSHRARIAKYFDPLPFWYPPFEERTAKRTFRCRHHAAADARCTIRGARRTPGCARSRPRTGSTCIATGRARSASPTATGCGSRARSAG